MADVQLIHPGLGPEQIITVPEEAQSHYYRSGWRLLADDEVLPEAAAEPVPEPMTRAQARAAAKAAHAAEPKE